MLIMTKLDGAHSTSPAEGRCRLLLPGACEPRRPLLGDRAWVSAMPTA